MTPAIVTSNVSRRHFLGGVLSAGAFVVAARFVPESLHAQIASVRSAADAGALNPRVYLGIDPDGRFLLAGNQKSDSLIVFRIDQQSGRLTPTGQKLDIGAPVSVKFVK